jgi:hypothetical protein
VAAACEQASTDPEQLNQQEFPFTGGSITDKEPSAPFGASSMEEDRKIPQCVDQGQHLAPVCRETRYGSEVDQLVGQRVGTELLGQGGRQPRPGDRSMVESHPKAEL